MNRWVKAAFLIIFLVLVLLFLFNAYHKSSRQEADSGRSYDEQLATYKSYMQKADAQNNEYLRKAELNAARSNEVNERMIKNQERFEKLLKRWEHQADQFDLLLSNWQRQGRKE